MREAVRNVFPSFSEAFEGSVPWMYLDVKGLVTTAIGNLVDPIQYALPLPWFKPDGTEASMEEVTQAWTFIKGQQWLAKAGHRAVPGLKHPHGNLVLSQEGIATVVRKKMEQNEYTLMSRFRDMAEWPADAQLFVHSMAWACGPFFRFTMLESFLKSQNFAKAAEECHMNEAGNPGLIPRNKANKLLLRNASVVVMSSLDRDRLWYPRMADPEGVPERTEVVTDNPNSELVLGSGPVIRPPVDIAPIVYDHRTGQEKWDDDVWQYGKD